MYCYSPLLKRNDKNTENSQGCKLGQVTQIAILLDTREHTTSDDFPCKKIHHIITATRIITGGEFLYEIRNFIINCGVLPAYLYLRDLPKYTALLFYSISNLDIVYDPSSIHIY